MRTVTVNVRDFVKAGGILSLAEWVELDEDERQACVKAREEVIQSQAVATAEVLCEVVRGVVEEMRAEHDLKRLIDHAEKLVE